MCPSRPQAGWFKKKFAGGSKLVELELFHASLALCSNFRGDVSPQPRCKPATDENLNLNSPAAGCAARNVKERAMGPSRPTSLRRPLRQRKSCHVFK